MKIKIHRGINQIGGCITEIATKKASILIDLGQNLPDGSGRVVDNLANYSAVESITEGVDAIFYTHYHGDHMGLFHYVQGPTEQYIGQVAREVLLCKHRQLAHIKGREDLSQQEIKKILHMHTFRPAQVVRIGDIKVIPYLVSHSAYDAYMFVIEAEGKRILHTGDFRGHAYLSKGMIPTLKNLILRDGEIDFLITEGTMLSRSNERLMSERELQREAEQIMGSYKNVFVLCSSTDMERLASFYAANKKFKNRPFICDYFQQQVLDLFSQTAGRYTSLFRLDKTYLFNVKNKKLIEWMEDKGFCMLVRATEKFKDYYQALAAHLNSEETLLIYSMWSEYINTGGKYAQQSSIEFVSLFPKIKKLHSSGHASPGFLAEVCTLVNPTLGIIPIHSENSANYLDLSIPLHLQQKVLLSSSTLEGVEIQIC